MNFGRRRFWFAGLVGVALFAATLVQADLKSLRQGLAQVDPFWIGMVLAAGALSYLCIAGVLAQLLKEMKHPLKFASVLRITLLACTLNHLMALGGLSGVAAKVYMLAQKKIPASRTLSVAMVHGFLTNTVAVVLIYLGFFFLYSQYKMSRREMGIGGVVLAVAFALTWITVKVIVDGQFRKKAWRISLRVYERVCLMIKKPHWLQRRRADAFFENFDESMNLFMADPRRLWSAASFAVLDWIFMFLCLKGSFLAANHPVDNRTLLVGFSVGIFTGIFSITPASIGVMEGSMAGSFYLMGVDYESALLATLIYRLAYYILPLAVSIPLLRTLSPESTSRGAHEALPERIKETKLPNV